MPNWLFEEQSPSPTAGVDEVGRGPLAGAVVAAAVILPCRTLPPPLAGGIKDSKKLSSTKREQLAAAILEIAHVGIGEASVLEIDRLNILQASFLAMQRAAANLPIPPAYILVDGNKAPIFSCPAQSIVKGDSLSYSIAAASIVAKVTRDKEMRRLHELYPHYGWNKNAGYGVPAHLLAIQTHGITPHHRRSFAPVKCAIGGHD